MTPTFKFNRIYKDVFKTNHRYIDIWGGRGRGGSHFGTDYFLFLITQPRYFRGYFVRQVLSDVRDSLFRDFKDRIEENETLNINDFAIRENDMRITYIPTGNTILAKGVSKDGSRTAKMKSLAGATHVLIEEADEIGESDFDQLDLSLRTIKADKVQIIRVFNPPSQKHWIWRDYNLIESDVEGFFKATPKTTSDLLAIWSTYKDNLKNLQPSTIAKFEAFKETNPDYYYNQVCGLISEGGKGRIYNGWQSISVDEYNRLDLPKVYGLDFGYSNDPNALIEIKYGKGVRYCRELIYTAGLDNVQLLEVMQSLGLDKSSLIIADTGSGGDLRIAEIRRGFKDRPNLRFNIMPALKGKGSIKFGINKVKENTTFVCEDSANLWNEYYEYKWRLDADKCPTDDPIDKFNHLMDAYRYAELAKGVYY
jgi:phage terminase large subunit